MPNPSCPLPKPIDNFKNQRWGTSLPIRDTVLIKSACNLASVGFLGVLKVHGSGSR